MSGFWPEKYVFVDLTFWRQKWQNISSRFSASNCTKNALRTIFKVWHYFCHSYVIYNIWYFGVILKHTGRWKNIQLYKWIVWNWKMTIEGNECQKYSLSCVLSKKTTIYILIMCWSKISLIQLFKRLGTSWS